MLKKIDWYLLKYFFLALFVVTVAIGLTIVIINMVEQLRDFVDNKVPIGQVLLYYLFFGGWVVKSFLPMFVLLATLFSVSILARRREILAMRACGLSLYRIALPYLLASVLIAVGHFYYNEYLFPPLNQRRLEMQKFTIEKKSKEALAQVRNVYRQIGPAYFYTIDWFDTERKTGTDLKLYRTHNNKLQQIITADRISFRDFRWVAEKGLVRDFDSTTKESFYRFDSLIVTDIKDKPEDFGRRLGDPQEMGLQDLKRFVDLMKRTGGPYQRESIDLQLKYAFPASSIIVVLICLPFASNPRRSGIAVSFALGVTIALLYFILLRVLQSAGWHERVPDLVAVWGVNAAFFLVGVVLMLGARK